MKRTLKKSMSILLTFTLLFGSFAFGFSDVDWSEFAVKAEAETSEKIIIRTNPERIYFSYDQYGDVYINNERADSFDLKIWFDVYTPEIIDFYCTIILPQGLTINGTSKHIITDLGSINVVQNKNNNSTEKSYFYVVTQEVQIDSAYKLTESEIVIKTYRTDEFVTDSSTSTLSVPVRKAPVDITEDDSQKIITGLSVQSVLEDNFVEFNGKVYDGVEYDGEKITDRTVDFETVIYNTIPSEYSQYGEYINSQSCYNFTIDSIMVEQGDFCSEAIIDGAKNVVIKAGESHTVKGKITLEKKPAGITSNVKETEADFVVVVKGTVNGRTFEKSNTCSIKIINTAYVKPIKGSVSSVDIKWPENQINLACLTELGLSLSECEDIADIVLVELAMCTLPPERLEYKISENILKKVFNCNSFLGWRSFTVKMVFPVTVEGQDMEIDIICKADEWSWDGTPLANFTDIKYKAYTLEGIFEIRKFHSDGQAGLATLTNCQAFMDSVHDFAVEEINAAVSDCFESKSGVEEIIFNTLADLVLSKTGKKNALDDAAVELYINAVKKIKINCPVDVFVYDTEGNLCAYAEDGVITVLNDAVELEINGSSKEITVYSLNCKIVTKATANGTMDISVEEYGCIGGAELVCEFKDVPLSPGKEYTMNVSNEVRESLSNYNLVSETGEVTEPEKNIVTGTCGENITWSLNLNNGKMFIEGTGEIKNYTGFSEYPWYRYRGIVKKIYVCDGITGIGNEAFHNFDVLLDLNIPKSVVSISDPFYDCGININVMTGNLYYSSINGVLFSKDQTELMCYPEGRSQSSFTIPRGTIKICKNAFSGSSSLKKIVTPDTLEFIDEYAFSRCNNLENIDLVSGLQTISSDAFYRCDRLKKIIIPYTVTSIEKGAFNYCSSLISISVDSSNSVYSSDQSGVLFNKFKTEIIKYPEGKTEETYSIPSSVTRINPSAFEKCYSLTNIMIPENITSICESAFAYCTALKKIELPSNLTQIGWGAFDGTAYSIDENNWENNVLYIGKYVIRGNPRVHSEWECTIKPGTILVADGAFNECVLLKKIVYPDGIVYISPVGSFCGVKEITIPDSVNKIEEEAFKETACLTDVYYGGTKSTWNGVNIGVDNDCLLNATIHFKAETTTQPATKPAETPSTEPSTKPEPTTKPVVEEEIIKKPSTSTVKYGETLILHADFADIPEGAKIEWSVEGEGVTINPSADGKTCAVTSTATGDVTITAKYTDSNGVEHVSEQEIKSNASFWQKIVSFFKNLFGLNRIIEQAIKF